MRTKKRVFRSFGYLECDAFAEYLKEMAASGWHFSFPEFTTSVTVSYTHLEYTNYAIKEKNAGFQI